jgi:hypothetical protein
MEGADKNRHPPQRNPACDQLFAQLLQHICRLPCRARALHEPSRDSAGIATEISRHFESAFGRSFAAVLGSQRYRSPPGAHATLLRCNEATQSFSAQLANPLRIRLSVTRPRGHQIGRSGRRQHSAGAAVASREAGCAQSAIVEPFSSARGSSSRSPSRVIQLAQSNPRCCNGCTTKGHACGKHQPRR